VEWEYCESAVEAIHKLKVQNSKLKVIAIEQDKRSVLYDKFDYKLPIALVVGHESDGISKEVLDLCDGIVELPMFGVNISLNVMVSLGVVLYEVIEKTQLPKVKSTR
jgi:tRNA G18 (ribose-2'-O)-methylase SpoU